MLNIRLMMFKILILSMLVVISICPVGFAGDTSNLEGAWLFNDDGLDAFTNGNDLTNNNTILFVAGKFGNAADLEQSSNQYWNITDASQTGLDIISDFTFGFWLKPESLGSDSTLGKGTNGYILRNNSAGNLDVKIGSTTCATIASAALSVATWTHIGVVFDDSANQIEVFVDGSGGNTCTNNDVPVNNASDFKIGEFADGSENYDGLVDDAFIFSRTLTSAEITDIKDNGLESFMSAGRNRVIIIS